MKKLSLLLTLGTIVAFCIAGMLACTTTALDQTGDQVTLETSALAMTIKRSPVPHIAGLVHKATGTALVGEPCDTPLFAVVLATPNGEDYVDSNRARTTGLNVRRTTAGSEIVMTFSGFQGLDLSVQVRGVFSTDDTLSRWTIDVQNRTGWKIGYVRFPIIRAMPEIGDGGDDVLVLPSLPGTLSVTRGRTGR